MPNVCGAVQEYSRALVGNWHEDAAARGAGGAPPPRFEGASEARSAFPHPDQRGVPVEAALPAPRAEALPAHLLLPHGTDIVGGGGGGGGGGCAPPPPSGEAKRRSSARLRKLKQDAVAAAPKVGELPPGAPRAAAARAGGGGELPAAGVPTGVAPTPPPGRGGFARHSGFTRALGRSVLTG